MTAVWITEFRARHGLELEALGGMIRRVGARMNPPLRVSDELLYRLESQKNFRTVPKLANLIAEVCGATAGQRDALVLKKYRGAWAPKPGAAFAAPASEKPKAPAPEKAPAATLRRKAVVCVDRAGNVLRSFPSIQAAAELMGVTKDGVALRVGRKAIDDEFKTWGVTFRLAEEWKAMGHEARLRDLRRTTEVKQKPVQHDGKRGGARLKRGATVITPDGNVLHFETIGEAARSTKASETAVYKRLAMETPIRNEYLHGNMYLYTSIWDLMSEEERERLRGRA